MINLDTQSLESSLSRMTALALCCSGYSRLNGSYQFPSRGEGCVLSLFDNMLGNTGSEFLFAPVFDNATQLILAVLIDNDAGS